MDMRLEGKAAVIVGGSRGIGLAIARALASDGCKLFLTARNKEGLDQAAQDLAGLGHQVASLAADITDASAAGHIVASAMNVYGAVDILVANAGGNRRKPFVEITDEDWRDLLELNLLGHMRCAREAVKVMEGGGAIIFVSSIFGREAGGPGLTLYNTTKSAMISAAKILSVEVAGQGIRVNTVAPGSIRFPGGSWDRRVQSDPEGMKAFVEANIPLGRFGTAEEVADVVTFLASERSSLVNGACLNVDGGQSRSLI